MSTTTTIREVADELRAIVAQLDSAEDETDVIGAIREDESVLDNIAREWPYTLSAYLAEQAPSILAEAVISEGGFAFSDADEAAEYLVREFPERLRDEQERQGETSGVDADEVDRIATELDGLAEEIRYVRNTDLDEVVAELDDLSRRVSDAASELQNLL